MDLRISYFGSFSAEKLKTTLSFFFSLDCFLSIFLNPPFPSKLLLFIAKVSGEITISASVSAIEGPVLSDLSEFLGESGVQQLWPWNLVPT